MESRNSKIEVALEEELKESIGLKDFEVDRIKERANLYFQTQAVNVDVNFAQRTMDKFLAGISLFAFCFLGLFCFGYLGFTPFLLFYIVIQALIIFWRFIMAPLNQHGFSSKDLLVRFRCYLPQEKRWKAFIKDDRYKLLLLVYCILDLLVFCSIIDAPRMLPCINNIIYGEGAYPSSLITSLVPGLVLIGLVVNVFGAIVLSRYETKVNDSWEKIKPRWMTLLLGVFIIASIFLFMLAGIAVSSDFAAYMKPAPASENWLYYFDTNQPLYRARLCVDLYYGLVYAGAVFLAFLAVSGLTVMESTIVLGRLNRHWSSTNPVENNWEFKQTLERNEKANYDKVKTRKRSLLEILIMCICAIVAMWLCLKWGGEIMKIKWMNYAGYGILGFMVLWIFFLSPLYHVKKDGTYHYPTIQHNYAYALFDERGLGSFKYYYREVFSKKRSLLLWTLYWILMLVSVFNFSEINLAMMNWKDLFGNPATQPSGVILDFAALFIKAPNEVTLAIVLVMTALSIVAFLVALGKTKNQFQGSAFWCIFYKILLGLVVICCFFWASKIYPVASSVNMLSSTFFTAIGVTILFFAIAAVIAVLFIIPFVMKFDNLSAPKQEIVIIIIVTIVLTSVILSIFKFVLPMTDIHGAEIIYGYPFRRGSEYDVQAIVDRFDLGQFFMEWFGRYIAWGAVQQFLFMSYFLTLWKKVFPRSKGYIIAVGTACIFGVIHAIDYPLMVFTAVAGMMWAYYWNKEYVTKTGTVVRGNNLLLWGLVHGFGGTLLGMLVPFTLGVGPFNIG